MKTIYKVILTVPVALIIGWLAWLSFERGNNMIAVGIIFGFYLRWVWKGK